ncbi:DNA-binding transcriptional regulator, LysR family [Rhodovulum sp. ES.010]|uniref:LysR substrate-binding domain-containing protein n=1 Tax=Rhodovulum sp. ES.010 TaxID=1882821 RepID=UPI00092BCEBC|nr:LysR substrate-binding domain-containing protein [Rhodovulum sp. ES.010]SIO07469.1 DNA-binding transcriptional regulator, LysR family [Rhodovulum sp. ES.010]
MKGRTSKGLSIAQLRAIEAVVRCGSFSAAAKSLGVSQPSVSTHVSTAERAARAVLFDRFGDSIRPAPALTAVLPQIRALLALYGDIEASFLSTRSVQKGALRIGYSTYQLAMPVIGSFMAAFPAIEIEARSLASRDVLAGLDAGRLDLGLVTGRELPAQMHGAPLVETPIVLVARPDHPLAARGRADWDDIAGLPLITREKGSGTRQLFEGAARLARIELNPVLALGSWGSIVAMVREGVGLGVAMRAELTATEGLVPITIGDGRLTARHFVVCPQHMARVAAVEAFIARALDKHDGTVTGGNS